MKCLWQYKPVAKKEHAIVTTVKMHFDSNQGDTYVIMAGSRKQISASRAANLVKQCPNYQQGSKQHSPDRQNQAPRNCDPSFVRS
jgi:hypothetical protein